MKEQLRRILVTGGAGYVGSLLVPALLAEGYEVTVLDWYLYGRSVFALYTNDSHLREVVGDIRDSNTVRSAMQGCDAVIHLACISNDPSYNLDPQFGYRVNHDGTKMVMDIAYASESVRRFIYASSSSVYGVRQEREVTEELPLSPVAGYSQYKAFFEPYILAKRSRIFDPIVVRPATICGHAPRMRFDLIVNLLTAQALQHQELRVFGGTQLRPNIHINDMVAAYLLLLEAPNKLVSGEIFNVGLENYSLLTIAEMVKLVINDSSIPIQRIITTDTRSYHISSKKIKRVLGFSPHHSIEEAISSIVLAYKKGLYGETLDDLRYHNVKQMDEWYKKGMHEKQTVAM